MLFGHSYLRSLTSSIALLLAFAIASPVFAIDKEKLGKALKNSTFDPTAKQVELFEGIENETIDYRLILASSKGGKLFLENKTDEPISVEMPPAVVGIHILAQPGGGFGGDTGGGGGQGQGGGNQAAGGGGLGGQQGGGQQGGGGNFFSIPPQAVLAVKLKTVCLEHGKPEPAARLTYKLIKVEDYSSDKRLHELLALVPSGKVNQRAAQAAAWHFSSKMSWQELVNKKKGRLGANANKSYFSRAEMQWASNLVSAATTRARVKEEKGTDDKVKKPVIRRTSIR